MTSSTPATRGALRGKASRKIRWPRFIADRVPVLTIVLVLIVIWYIAAILMNMTLVRDAFEREDIAYTFADLIAGTLDAERPLVAAPHQIVAQFISCSVIRRTPRAASSTTAGSPSPRPSRDS
jgi:NitT/TauT family transport system permease protein